MTNKKKNFPLLKSSNFNLRTMIFFASALVIAGFIIVLSQAAPPPPTVYLAPNSIVMGVNGNFSVQVRENSSTTTVNAVQANFSYPASLVDFVSISGTGSAFTTEAQATGGTGQVNIARGIIGSVTGDQLVATVNFKAKTTGGIANMAFTTGTALVNSSTNQNLLSSLAVTGGGSYTIDTAGPSVSVTSPANSSSIGVGTTVNVAATATDVSAITKVEFYIDGVLKSTDLTSPYAYSWSTTGLTLGAHTIQAKSTDSFSNIGSSSIVNVTVADQTDPIVSLSAPSAGVFVSGSAVAVSATAADNIGVSGVQFKLDGANIGVEDTVSPYSISWNSTGATNGIHTLTAFARDAAGNTTTSAGVTLTVDNADPTVSINSPATGSTVSGTTTVTATAADNAGGSGLAKVEIFVDGVLKVSDTTSPYTYSWDTSAVTDGAHSLSAKAYDRTASANSTTSATVNVTVDNSDNTPPSTPGSLQVTSKSLTSVSLAWNASTDNVGVKNYQVKRNGTTVATTTALSYTNSGLAPETTYSYTVVAVDAAGNVSSPAGPLSVTTLTPKPGDANLDNAVDLFDLSILLSNYDTSNASCDFNNDGIINIFDLSILLTNYGT
jgi:chitinase